MKIYLAGPIFNYGDLLRNTEWANKLRTQIKDSEVYNPLEADFNGVEGKKKFGDSKIIADGDNKRLDETDILVACIDGDVIPAGTSAEIGKFHEKVMRGEHKLIVGICTDNRQCYLTHSAEKDEGGASSLGEQQYSYQNLYVTGLIKQAGVLVTNIEDAIDYINAHWEEDDKSSFDDYNMSVDDLLQLLYGESEHFTKKEIQGFLKNIETMNIAFPEYDDENEGDL